MLRYLANLLRFVYIDVSNLMRHVYIEVETIFILVFGASTGMECNLRTNGAVCSGVTWMVP